MYLKSIVLIISIIFSIGNSEVIGFIEVTNKGGYTSRFTLTYNVNNQDIFRTTPSFNMYQTEYLITPNGASNIRLKVQYMVFLGVWKTLFEYTLPSTSRCFDLYGTVFNPSWSPRAC